MKNSQLYSYRTRNIPPLTACAAKRSRKTGAGFLLAPVICLMLIAGSLPAFAQNFEWAHSIGGIPNDQGRAVAVDAAGNVYATGGFTGTADFDPGPGTANHIAAGSGGSNFDIYIAKYTAAGAYLWSISMGSSGGNRGTNMVLDAAGNVYVAGMFSGTVDFDPGPGTANLTATGGGGRFIAKYDSGGNYVWAIGMSSTGSTLISGLALDAAGNIYLAGSFGGISDFNPGPATANLSTTGGILDAFISKYDASGNYVWAKKIGGTSPDHGGGIATDASGNVYLSGYFQATVDFDPGPGVANLTSFGVSDNFIAKYDSGGNYLWVFSIGGDGSEQSPDVTTDAAGNVYVTGYFGGTADFDPGPGTANLTSGGLGSADIFLAKYDAGGNYLWANRMGGTETDHGIALTTDAGGNVYVTGRFETTVDFDPGPATANLTAAGSRDIFVAKYAAGGNYVWATGMGGSSIDEVFDIAADAAGNVYATGLFNGTADFDPGPGIANLTSAGGPDIFILKLSQPPLAVSLSPLSGRMTAAGNALLTWTTYNEQNNRGFAIEHSTGGKHFREIGFLASQAAAGNSIKPVSYHFTDPLPLTETAFYRLRQMDNNGQSAYSNIVRLQHTGKNGAGVFSYPNPANEVVHITAGQPVHVTLTDITGRLLQDYKEASSISLCGLPQGIYFIRISDGAGNLLKVEKIIKQ